MPIKASMPDSGLVLFYANKTVAGIGTASFLRIDSNIYPLDKPHQVGQAMQANFSLAGGGYHRGYSAPPDDDYRAFTFWYAVELADVYNTYPAVEIDPGTGIYETLNFQQHPPPGFPYYYEVRKGPMYSGVIPHRLVDCLEIYIRGNAFCLTKFGKNSQLMSAIQANPSLSVYYAAAAGPDANITISDLGGVAFEIYAGNLLIQKAASAFTFLFYRHIPTGLTHTIVLT